MRVGPPINASTPFLEGVANSQVSQPWYRVLTSIVDMLGNGQDIATVQDLQTELETASRTASSALVANSARSLNVTDDNDKNATVYPTWVVAGSGTQSLETSSQKLQYNPSIGTLSIHSGGIGIDNTDGYALASTVNGTAVGFAGWFLSNNPNGYALYAATAAAVGYGYALGVSGPSTFQQGKADFTNGGSIGISIANDYGIASTVTGTTAAYAVWGKSDTNPNGFGVFATSSNSNPAVSGYALGVSGAASFVSGKTDWHSGGNIGVSVSNDYGIASTVNGTVGGGNSAIWGYSHNTSATSYGGYFSADNGGTALGVSGPMSLNASQGNSGDIATSQGAGSSAIWKNFGMTAGAHNNYVTLPGGMIMQWGEFHITSGTGIGSVTFDLTFPNQCNGISATVAAGSPNSATCSVSTVSVSGATFGLYDTTAHAGIAGYVFWTAMGY